MNFAPIVLFCYNRPWHTQMCLDALAQNPEAKYSTLYIYCDGEKNDSSEEAAENIKQVRIIVRSETRFKEVYIIEQETNKGLTGSIIAGVSEIINRYGKIIVLEDDIVPSVGFLKYMNEALALYMIEEKVGCIHAWNYCLDSNDYNDSTFFLRGADCWGWATWARSWNLFNQDGRELLNSIIIEKLEFDFDRRGTHPFTIMLKDQIEGKNDSWAIRWHASLFLMGKYCLQPTKSIVKNIGLDSSGVHCGHSYIKQAPIDYINLTKLDVRESEWFFKEYLHLENENVREIKSIRERMMVLLKGTTNFIFRNLK